MFLKIFREGFKFGLESFDVGFFLIFGRSMTDTFCSADKPECVGVPFVGCLLASEPVSVALDDDASSCAD
ncbi:hypothetical protein DJ78_13540 [Halorubrum ezzemoulense]|uniref:Uncharacterized protein n=1 Tax=Halorubrum ezzemoulense TaxID=337243 RepID=A0A256JIM3_HALEZ|nr:hypothetical protein DJ78_13540 [Halorubrum ezzemoulense]